MLYEWLKDYMQLKQDVEYLEFKIEREEVELRRWTSGDLQNVKLQSNSIAAGLEERIDKLKKEVIYKKRKLNDLVALIEKFEGVDNQILRMKWCEGKTLEEIAYELNYSYGYIKQRHANVMRMINFADTFKVR